MKSYIFHKRLLDFGLDVIDLLLVSYQHEVVEALQNVHDQLFYDMSCQNENIRLSKNSHSVTFTVVPV